MSFDIKAPAKLNLTLEVLRKRPDGYHEIRSVLQVISLCDNLRFQEADGIEISASNPEWLPEKSLVARAASLVQGCASAPRGARIVIEKRIPLVAGLGGDSSDAAATLLGLDRLWKLEMSRETLLEMAAGLGSDVPFFLYGGTALAAGRGEVVTPLPPFPCMWVVLIVPPGDRLPGKTARLYSSLKASDFSDGSVTEAFVSELEAGRAPAGYFNVFEKTAFASGETRAYLSRLAGMGATGVHLAGSGPALFTLPRDGEADRQLYGRCRGAGLEAYLAQTGSP
ncbi:MAG: 4-(cytidine 5'-diphospho)-2-C-methyl-D-erythritol kinase [Chloroflexi bacterium]|nr:4-(cytidine 5'-diphospho)-2-C-methyl-D-erythritol kinase [Chloroflexota bacterium]